MRAEAGFVSGGAARRARSPALERPGVGVLALVVLGCAASAVALWANRTALMQLAGFSWRFTDDTVLKSALYYYAHGAQLAAVTLAGAAALVTRSRGLPRSTTLAFAALQAAGGLMAVRGLTLDDVFSTRVVAATGPFVTVISVLAFVAIRRVDFEIIDRGLVLLAWIASGAVLYAVATLESLAREDAALALQGPLNVLFWVAAWLVVRPPGRRLRTRLLRWVPLLVYGAGSVLTQTRLNFVMLALAVMAYVYVTARRTGRRVTAIAGFVPAVALLVLGLLLLADTPVASMLSVASSAFAERLTEDTRSGQIFAFFDDVAPWELLLGRGARATWNWPGMSAAWSGGTDVGYLSLLFFGGVPLLVAYAVFHFRPAWRVLRAPGAPWALGPAVMVLLWGVRMLSSSFPTLGLDYYPVLLFVGACIGADARSRAGDGAVRPGVGVAPGGRAERARA